MWLEFHQSLPKICQNVTNHQTKFLTFLIFFNSFFFRERYHRDNMTDMVNYDTENCRPIQILRFRTMLSILPFGVVWRSTLKLQWKNSLQTKSTLCDLNFSMFSVLCLTPHRIHWGNFLSLPKFTWLPFSTRLSAFLYLNTWDPKWKLNLNKDLSPNNYRLAIATD